MSYLFFFYFIHFFFLVKNEIKVGEVRRRARVNQRPEILGPGPFGFTCEGRNTRTRTKYFFFFWKKKYISSAHPFGHIRWLFTRNER